MPAPAMLGEAESALSGFGGHPVTSGVGNRCNMLATSYAN